VVRWPLALRDWIRRYIRNQVALEMIRPVRVTSPHPPHECARRLAATTARSRSGWLLSARTATLPDPLFVGEVGSSVVRVALFSAVGGRAGGSTCAWFDALLDPTPAGGTALTGTIGNRSAESATANAVLSLVVLTVMAGLGLFFPILGIVIAASGHFNGGVGVAIGLPILFGVSVLAARGRNSLPTGLDPIPALLEKIDHVLDATSD
jgi:hypothetical protein